ncbi:MAG TPA: hypothetical protein VNZ66_01335 [Aeromicrobium sp.]|nr:hypothetical protein [Aeromicrobium sp.]
MDETSFEINRADLSEASRRFPAHRLPRAVGRPTADVTYLAAPGAEFARHAWDEGGHS